MISVSVTYRPGRVLELTISIEVWLHPEEEPLFRLMIWASKLQTTIALIRQSKLPLMLIPAMTPREAFSQQVREEGATHHDNV